MLHLWLTAVLLLVALPALAEDKPARGMFLVADRQLSDPNFARSVVLLVDYGEHGAAGLIVNRRTEALLADLLPDLEGAADVAGRVFLGGPVSPEGVLVLLRAEETPEAARPVFDDVHVTSSREILERQVESGGTFRGFAGHAGWAPGQLDWELRQGGWFLLPADVETVFDEEPEDVWRKLIRRADSPLASAPRNPILRIGFLGPAPPSQSRTRSAHPALDSSLRPPRTGMNPLTTRNRLRTPRQGADTIGWLAACERVAGETGKLYFDRRAVKTHFMKRTRTRPGDRQRLWRLCCEQAGVAEEEPCA